MLVQPREIDDFPDHKLVIISTGSQGEPLSALRRMAHNDHRHIKLHDGDTVVFSATPIPGNERAVNDTIDRLYHIGCDVITTADAPIHASGHGYREELKLMLNLTKPRYVLPMHGDFKRIHLHAQLAEAVGIDAGRTSSRARTACRSRSTRSGARFGDREQSGMIFVDGVDIGDPADVALRDRRMLSADGIFIVVATISEQDGQSVAPPEVIFRGVPFVAEADELIEEIRGAVEDSLSRAAGDGIREVDLVQQELHDDLAAFVYDRLKRRPDGASSRRRGVGRRLTPPRGAGSRDAVTGTLAACRRALIAIARPVLADDEACCRRLSGSLFCERLVERAVGRDAVSAGDAAEDRGDRGGVAGLDREDRDGRLHDGRLLDVGGLAGVGLDAGVLERERGRRELGLVGRRVREVESRRLHRSGAERSLEEADVRRLVGADELRERADHARESALFDGLLVERRLEVLERQREVEDRAY